MSRRQLIAIGCHPEAIMSWLRRGRLLPIRRGVYAVGHRAVSPDGHFMAATLSVPGSALSHRTAAHRHGLRPTSRAAIELSAPGRARGRALEVHETRLDRADVTRIGPIPITTVARTIVDMSAVLDERGLARLVSAAESARAFDLHSLEAASRRAGARHRGRSHLRRVLALQLDPDLAESELERRFADLVADRGLPVPEVNVPVAVGARRYRLDFLWRDVGLAVETDGIAHHRSAEAFRGDRRRDQLLRTAGIETIRFTWDQVVDRPWEVEEVLRPLLARAGVRRP